MQVRMNWVRHSPVSRGEFASLTFIPSFYDRAYKRCFDGADS